MPLRLSCAASRRKRRMISCAFKSAKLTPVSQLEKVGSWDRRKSKVSEVSEQAFLQGCLLTGEDGKRHFELEIVMLLNALVSVKP